MHTREFSNALLRRSLFLSRGRGRLKVEPDSTLSYLYSSRAKRILFGRSSVEPFKVQAGVLIPLRQKETRVRLSPVSIEFLSRPQDQIQISQFIHLVGVRQEGYMRRIHITNRSEAPLRVRLLTSHDPTSINFRKDRDPPGEIGLNAFNRGDHVVMDDVGDTTGARVIGFSPQPSTIYMTKDRQRAQELLGSGELPDSTAGMSGSIMMIAQHEAEIPSGRSFDISVVSLYHDSSLGDILSEFPSLLTDSAPPAPDSDFVFECSNPAVSFAHGWAKGALHAIEAEPDIAERIFVGFALGVVRAGRFEEEFQTIAGLSRRDGFVPRTPERGGPLETSLFITASCSYLQLKDDKKLARKWYPVLRRAGSALKKAGADGLVHAAVSSPDGWRRRLGSGFPTGVTSEVNLAAARALRELATLANALGKGADSAAFSESSIKITSQINERLRDTKTGNLALNLDPKGRLHLEPTLDQAVALSNNPYDHGLASSLVHRLLEKDFDSGYGPRCIPTSNALYYSPTYGDGQLGSCWTRGSLYHSILAYLSGYPVIGGMQLEKVARLVYSDWENLGGAPGEFPYWIDSEKRTTMGSGSDPVAAGLFIQALLIGELGFTFSPDGVRLTPPDSSRLRWVLAYDLNLGEKGCVFVGRSSGGVWVASTFQRVKTSSPDFQGCEHIETADPPRVMAFWGKSSVTVCAGNSGSAPWSGDISVSMKGKPLAASLYADVDELDQETLRWKKIERKRILDTVGLHLSMQPSSWQVFRFTRV